MSNYSKQVKKKLKLSISHIVNNKEAFVRHPDKDFTRNRKLSFENLINFFLNLGGKDIGSELLDFLPPSCQITVSGFTQQRDKLLPETFKALLTNFNARLKTKKSFKGFKIVAVDGSKLSIACNPNDKESFFKTKKNIQGSNRLHINALYDVLNNIYLDAIVQPGRKRNEHQALVQMIKQSTLSKKVILLADRGYESYNTFAHLVEKEWKFLIRVKDVNSKSILSGLNLPTSGEFDHNITRIFTKKRTKEILSNPDVYKTIFGNGLFDFIDNSNNLFHTMTFRVVKVEVGDGSFQCFVTNLDPDEFTLHEIRELYRLRWGIETSFRDLKHKLGLTHLHSKKVEHIIQEVFAKMVMYNFCSIITSHVVIQKKDRKHQYQVNFSKAITICKRFFKLRNNAHLPDVEAQIQQYILPIRKERLSPRITVKKEFVGFNYRLA